MTQDDFNEDAYTVEEAEKNLTRTLMLLAFPLMAIVGIGSYCILAYLYKLLL